MKDNRGFSLVELIVVILLMGVLITFMTVRTGVVFNYSAKEARTKLNTTLESLRISCMSKSKKTPETIWDGSHLNSDLDVYIEIYQKSVGDYYIKYHEIDEIGMPKVTTIKLASNGIGITYVMKGETAINTIGAEGSGLFLAYNRSTGGFIPQKKVGTTYKQVQYIYCGSGEKTYTLELMPSTGKVSVR